MESWLEFARGPLFRLSFAILILGLLRILFLDIWGAYKAYRKAGDKSMPWKLIFSRSMEWLFPVKRVAHNRPVYSIFSILFHIGLILVPIFLFAHVKLWKRSVGISWMTLPYNLAYWLTVSTIVFAIALIIGRIFNKSSSFISRKQDYLWPVLLIIPFITGFVCANLNVDPKSYQFFMLMHVLSGDLIFVLIPFTKIAHCVLMPLSQVVCTLAWKFPPNTDEDICTTLNKKGAPV
ncbi:respiratory nitrate reductase subunit gamma [bacterium BMS3Abin03]|nr:respiratory nitrate reductase subunit gamma [bacterium BMS3Abin03]MCG6958827.1 respiratory nitrate reductase subunit gamma [bacterium BMS3Abin03]